MKGDLGLNMNKVDVLIVGAGQAGLAMGYYLQRYRKNFVILDQGTQVGEVWRRRYDSLQLFTPRMFSSLPGLALEGDPHGLPTKDEVADYLKRYAMEFSLPIQLRTTVLQLTQNSKGFCLETNRGTYWAGQVIIATGPFHTKRVPDSAKHVSSHTLQIHSSEYTNASQLNEGNVLVVGGGNSGAQIAVELAETRKTFLAVSKPLRYFPLTVGRKSVFWWFDKIGLLHAASTSIIGRKLREKGDPVFGYQLRSAIKQGKVKVKGKVSNADGRNVFFEDGTSIQVGNIIWATGFEPSYDWIHIDGVLNKREEVIHERGVSPVKGLYFLGLLWQSHRGSSLLQGVGNDANYIMQQIVDYDLDL